MTMIHPDTIVIHDEDTLAELVEAWGHIARTAPGEGRTRRCDAIVDEVAKRAVDPHEAATPTYPTQQ